MGRNCARMTIVEIRPHRWGWKVFEAPGVEPVFGTKAQAIDYAETRACFRHLEMRVVDAAGNINETVALDDRERRL
jgi:hypothetical protein